eukprot:TRINITY_DN8316_c0_g1_i1.p1 TRINITY_DN8316_c0_g1~~TRINITY_DN8316_c0_g1_i1.p1  ORF type:complete len:176 (+),score=5.65 TRINITY_DN8316_c0_g1_i1:57-584(+)
MDGNQEPLPTWGLEGSLTSKLTKRRRCSDSDRNTRSSVNFSGGRTLSKSLLRLFPSDLAQELRKKPLTEIDVDRTISELSLPRLNTFSGHLRRMKRISAAQLTRLNSLQLPLPNSHISTANFDYFEDDVATDCPEWIPEISDVPSIVDLLPNITLSFSSEPTPQDLPVTSVNQMD